MSSVDLKALRKASESELKAKALEYKDELFTARFGLKTGQLADSSKLRKARRAFAKVQTIISERRTASADGAA